MPGTPRGFAEIDTWVFDLDNTLYPHHVNLWQQVDARIGEFVGRWLNVSAAEARAIQKDYYLRYGTTMRGMMTEHGVRADDYLAVPGGYVFAGHCRPLAETEPDVAATAERLVGTPYLWGGRSGLGVDCSGLVQLALRMTGRNAPRDTDMQAASIGEPFEPGPGLAGLRRGDLVFWKGHVAIMTGDRDMIHASGHTMTVAREGLAEAVERIGYLYGGPTGFRRL